MESNSYGLGKSISTSYFPLPISLMINELSRIQGKVHLDWSQGILPRNCLGLPSAISIANSRCRTQEPWERKTRAGRLVAHRKADVHREANTQIKGDPQINPGGKRPFFLPADSVSCHYWGKVFSRELKWLTNILKKVLRLKVHG